MIAARSPRLGGHPIAPPLTVGLGGRVGLPPTHPLSRLFGGHHLAEGGESPPGLLTPQHGGDDGGEREIPPNGGNEDPALAPEGRAHLQGVLRRVLGLIAVIALRQILAPYVTQVHTEVTMPGGHLRRPKGESASVPVQPFH